MNERVSAASLPTGKRIPASRLTPTERETLEKEGRISPDGFVDVEPLEAPQMVDVRSEARKSAVDALKSVEKVQSLPGAQKQSQQDAEYTKGLHDEIARLNKELAERQGCPRCGFSLKEKYEVEPTRDDIEEFLKCVLAGTVYTKEFSLFGGKLKVKLRTRTGAEEDAIKKAIVEFFKESQGASETEVLGEIQKYTLAASLCAYNGKEYPSISTETFKAAATERISTIPAQIQGFLRTTLQQFNVLTDRLTARAQDPNFWTGTAV